MSSDVNVRPGVGIGLAVGVKMWKRPIRWLFGVVEWPARHVTHLHILGFLMSSTLKTNSLESVEGGGNVEDSRASEAQVSFVQGIFGFRKRPRSSRG
jgi:hypothetical protein